MEFEEMEKHIKETHNKFFFVFREKELKQLEKKIGIELDWVKVGITADIPEHIKENFIIIDFEKIHFAEIEKNDENIILLEKALGKIPFDKDCFCFDGFVPNKKEVKV